MWTFLWLSHNSEKGYAVVVTFRHHRHTACHTTSVGLSTYCDITMAATVTMTLAKEVGNMQIGHGGLKRSLARFELERTREQEKPISQSAHPGVDILSRF